MPSESRATTCRAQAATPPSTAKRSVRRSRTPTHGRFLQLLAPYGILSLCMSIKGPKEEGREGGVATDRRTKKKLARPRLYKVLFHNDDFTTKWFVVAVLEQIFHHNEAQANTIMMHVHQTGIGVAGVFTFEIAETK